MKILHFIYGLAIGGAETFLQNMITGLKGEGFEFHFAIQNPDITNPFFQDLRKLHPDCFHVLPPFPKRSYSQFRVLKTLLSKQKFHCIHIHANALINTVPILCAKATDTPVILHSHNTSNNEGGLIGRYIHLVNRLLFKKSIYSNIACSSLAGEWMFKNTPYRVLNNAIPVDKFLFFPVARNTIRNKYDISPDCTVIGTICRLTPQKNLFGLIDIFHIYYSYHQNCRLLIVGDGPLKDKLIEYAQSKGIGNVVIFMGQTSTPELCYSAIDCFMITSFFEGLCFTAVEAQANGLPILASSTVTQEIQLSDRVTFIPLYNPVNPSDLILKNWTDSIEEVLEKNKECNRIEMGNRVKNSKFALSSLVDDISAIYRNICLRHKHNN